MTKTTDSRCNMDNAKLERDNLFSSCSWQSNEDAQTEAAKKKTGMFYIHGKLL